MRRSLAIAIPSFNDEATLGETLRSIAAQTVQPSIVYVVDDCSMDRTIEVAEKFSAVIPLTIIRNDCRLGLVGNWNRCIDSSEEDYLWILHSDDWLHPSAVELVLALISEGECGLICTRSVFFENATCEASKDWESAAVNPSWEHYGRGGPAFGVALGFICSSVVVARALYLAHGSFSDEFPYSPDEEMWPRLARVAAASVLSGGALTAVRSAGLHEMHRTWLQADFDSRWIDLHEVLSRWASELDPGDDSQLVAMVARKLRLSSNMVNSWRVAQSRRASVVELVRGRLGRLRRYLGW